MTYKRSILQVLIVVLVSSVLLFPVAGLKSSLAQETGYDGTAYAGTLADAEIRRSAVALAEGVQCPANTTAYWKLDETGGPTYEDSHDGHDAACAGACPSAVDGQVNGGQAFDGSTTGLDVPVHTAFDWDGSDNFTIEFWMYRSGEILRNAVVVGRDDTPNSSLHWWVGLWKNDQRRGLPEFYLTDTGGNSYSVQGTTFLTDGAWHHIVAVRDDGNRELRIYVDGALEATTTDVNYLDGFDSPTAAVNIGWIDRAGTAHGYRFGGIVDEVAIYGTAMTDAEVAEHYARGRAGQGPCRYPSIAVEKTADPTIIYAGETVVYSYAVTNDGDTPLVNVNVADDKCSPLSDPQGGDGDAELDPNEVWNYTCSMAVSADITNTVTASGTYTYPVSGTTSGTDTRSVDVIDPDVVVNKTADPARIYPGTTVTYTYAVTNQGSDTLSNVGISDDKCASVTTVVGDNTLSPGETQTYTCSTVVSQDTTNTATFVGTDLLGTIWTFTGQAFVNVISPQIAVEKTPSATAVYVGETVVYNYTVRNPGNDPLSTVSVSDDKCSPVTRTGGDTNGNNKLDPGEAWTYVCSVALDAGTLNKATARGTDSLGGTVSAQDTAFVSVISPQIAIEKVADKTEAGVGESVKYTYTVWNIGDDPLSSVTVGDNKCNPVSGPQGDTNGNGKLDLGERWTFTCSTAHSNPGETTNTATVTGSDSAGRTQSAQDTATVVVGNRLIYLPIVLRAPQS
jgi:ethanolamine utilization microcompartment shell protein EutS